MGDAIGDVGDGLFGVGQRQQVVQVGAVHAGPAQVIGDPGRLDAFGKLFQFAQIPAVQRVGAADGQRHAVHDHGVAFADAIQVVQRLAAGDHVVFAQDLEPVHRRPFVDDGLVVVGAQAQPITQWWRTKVAVGVSHDLRRPCGARDGAGTRREHRTFARAFPLFVPHIV